MESFDCECFIRDIIDNDNYIVRIYKNKINKINKLNKLKNINILIPNVFRIRFDLNNSLATVLGFNTVCTDYGNVICNKKYDNNKQILTDEHDSIYIVCENIKGIICDNKIQNIFYKIILNSNKERIYNSFVPINYVFDNEKMNLSQLEFKFYDVNGDLVNFENNDHSFTLEISNFN